MITFERAMEEALKTSKYDFLTGRKEKLSEKLFKIFVEIIEKIFKNLDFEFKPSNSFINPNVLFNIFIIIFVIMIVLLIGIIVYFFLKRKRKTEISSEIFDEFRQNSLTAKELIALANKAESNNDYRLAVRYNYLAIILIMTDKNIVTITDSMTGSQFLREIKRNESRFFEGVNDTINMFYYLWFGNKSVSTELYDNYKSSYDNLVKEATDHE